MHATQRQRRPPLLRARAPARSARLDDVIGHVTTNYFRPTAVIDVRKACAQNQPIYIRTAGPRRNRRHTREPNTYGIFPIFRALLRPRLPGSQ